ncbi:enoyl-CoA hydratase/isomerase family protein [Jatrophihabitans sp. DSM 45814]
MNAATSDPVSVSRRGALGHLTLNRPEAINALSHRMVNILGRFLEEWRMSEDVRHVVVDGAGERGLCAGGDIRAIYHDGLAGGRASELYWADEYRLDAAIARYRKPIVAFMDGIVLGAGVGVSAHSSHRVVCESSSIGMPEVAIGFCPDVGGTYLLSRAPGELGTHLALTASRMNAADAIYCGFADIFIPRAQRDQLLTDLETSRDVGVALQEYASDPGQASLPAHQSWIDECYSPDTVEEILERLHSHSDPAAQEAAVKVESASPTSLKVALRALREARADAQLEYSLIREMGVSLRCIAGREFIEGIRAQVIDKDRQPRWNPATLTDVSNAIIDSHFDPVNANKLAIYVPGLEGNHGRQQNW